MSCHGLRFLAERLGSGDGERKTLLTRQIAFEPLPASVLFALGWFVVLIHGGVRCALRSQSQPNFSSGLAHFGQGVRSFVSWVFAIWQTGQ